ncbi:MAG: NAD(P)-binding domain-containing protein [Bacteroidota bacterium]
METNHTLPVIIIGAGPVGLAAASHLALRNQPFLLFEGGSTVASHMLSWGHVRVFSPWKYNIDQAARTLLNTFAWKAPEEEGLPTGRELYEQYFFPLSQLAALQPFIKLNSRVIAISRKNTDKMKDSGRSILPFIIQVLHDGHEVRQYEAKAVIDASGTWGSPNPIGSGGLLAVGEQDNQERIFYGIPDILRTDRERYQNKSVLVVGSGHSAINAILDMARLKKSYPETQIHWVLRKNRIEEVYGGQEKDALPARGALGIRIAQLVAEEQVHVYTPFQIEQIRKVDNQLTVIGYQHEQPRALPGIDEIISNTGSRPDFSFLREVRLHMDPALESTSALASLIDPNVHSCGTVRPHGELELRHPDHNFYIVGAKSYGRAPTFLMATGYEQVRSIVAALDGDWEAAQRVALELPETGVCSLDAGAGCCTTTTVSGNVTKPTSCCG